MKKIDWDVKLTLPKSVTVKDEYVEPKDEFKEHVDGITDEAKGMITGLRALGWNILYPLIPLIGLVALVVHALRH